MKFRKWLFENDETQERTNAFQQYVQALTTLATKYKTTLHPAYIEHEKKTFMTMPIDQLRQEVANLPKHLKDREDDFKREEMRKSYEAKRSAAKDKSPGLSSPRRK